MLWGVAVPALQIAVWIRTKRKLVAWLHVYVCHSKYFSYLPTLQSTKGTQYSTSHPLWELNGIRQLLFLVVAYILRSPCHECG